MLVESTAASWQAQYRERVEALLERRLPGPDVEPVQLHRAMRYAALGQGKRIRPLLVYATGAAIGVAPEALDAPAAAAELIHAYSLVHDDLPAMDDDDLRRGRPTTHRAFDEATAILAGDALQVLAFEILAQDPMPTVSDAGRVDMIRLLARASGTQGMAGGQAMDLAATGRRLEPLQIEAMHSRKTGALIRASVLFACAAAPALPAEQREALDRYGQAVGLSFQIVDDLLDVLGDPLVTGKGAGLDALRGKPTYPAIAGVAAARARANELAQEGIEALAGFGLAARQLRDFAGQLVARGR
ncbi:MAG: polyprenyl synthetase family protein [Steroidobacteraceae bacterium]